MSIREIEFKKEFVTMDPARKASIVARVEASLGFVIIDPARTECLEGCKCIGCFHKFLDASVVRSDASLADVLSTQAT